MPLLAGNTVEMRAYVKSGPQIAINVFHYRVFQVGATAATMAQLVELASLQFGPLYKALMTAQATFQGIVGQRIHPLPPDEPVLSSAGAGAGTVAGDPLPLQTTGMITKKTGFAGRAFRGRVYVPFPGEGSNDLDGSPTAIYLGDLQLLADQFKADITVVAAGEPTTLRPILKNKNWPGQLTTVTSLLIRDKWAVQRRRGSYGQPNTSPF